MHRAFNLSPGAWDRARDGGARPGVSEVDAYAVLGVARDVDDEEVRMVWRRLVREHHPDVLSARGATPAQQAQSAARIAQINAAWDRIKRDRRL